jgi:hypothetical protein
MNVNKVLTKDYENKPNWTPGENEPKTNPIKANRRPLAGNPKLEILNPKYAIRNTTYDTIMQNKAKTKPIFKSEDRPQKTEYYRSCFLGVCLAGPKHINEMRIKAPPEKNSIIRRLGSLQRVSHKGITGSAGCWFGSSARTLRATANCSAVAFG